MAKDIFKDQKARKRQEEWYNHFLEKVNCKIDVQVVPTFAGNSHVLMAGDSSKPPLLCLHAMLTGSAHLLSEIRDLTQDYYLIIPDIPGHSVRGIPKRLSYENGSYSRWLADIVDDLELKSLHILGISLGGFIAHRFAVKWPKKVEKLFLIVPAGIVQGSVFKVLMRMFIPMLKFRLNPTDKNLREVSEFLLSNWDDDWGTFLGDSMRDFSIPKKIPPVSSDEDLRKLSMPGLIIAADQDISFPGKLLVERVQELMPAVETELLQNTSHSPPTTPEFRKWLAERVTLFFS